jgi:hypothetical protein
MGGPHKRVLSLQQKRPTRLREAIALVGLASFGANSKDFVEFLKAEGPQSRCNT